MDPVGPKVFKRVLKVAGLPSSLSPHALRHTFAIRLIKSGAPLTYVRDLLGHSSITVTADVYARHLPTGDRGLLDRLEDVSGSRTVAVAGETWSRRSGLNRGPADCELPSARGSRRNGAVTSLKCGIRARGWCPCLTV